MCPSKAGGWDEDLEVVITTAIGCTIPFAAAALADGAEADVVRLGLDGMDWPNRQCAPSRSSMRVV